MVQSRSRFKFTQKTIAAIKPGPKPQLFYDNECVGLGLRVSPKGKRTFFHQSGSRRNSITAQTLATARTQVHAQRAAFSASGEAAEWTLGFLFDLWMETKSKPKKRTWKRDQSRWDQYLRHWRNRKLPTVKRIEVIQLHNRINNEVGPYAANDTVAFIRSLYNYAETFEYEGRNPATRIDLFPEQERERYLLPEEFPRWHSAVMGLRYSEARDFFLLALWTGIRREAVMSMRWEHIDLEAGIWRISRADDKGKRDLIIYLSEEAMAILKRRHAIKQSDWVLPSPNGSASGHYADPKAAWASVLRRSGISDLRIHDLRRTLGSWMAEGGTNLHIIGKVLGHKSQQATRIYARLGGTAVRSAVNAATKAMKSTLPE